MSTNQIHKKSDIPSIMLVVGEASGDLHAASLLSELKRLSPRTNFFGMGGSKMREAGFDAVVDSEKSASIMGISEVIAGLRKIFNAFNLLVKEAEKRNPSLIVFVDFAEFNMRLAKKLHKKGYKTVYFIVPKVWAWRQSRVKSLRKHFDKLLAIFPFEVDFYKKHGASVEYIGNPFLDFQMPETNKRNFFNSHGLSESLPTLGLLPGSRKSEISTLLPLLVETYKKLKKERPNLQAIIPLAPTIDKAWFNSVCEMPSEIVICHGKSHQILSTVDAAVIASGTATLEATIFSLPFTVVYKLSPFSYFIGKTFIKGVNHISLTNILAGKEVVREFVQEEASLENVSAEAKKLLFDEKYRAKLAQEFSEIKKSLKLLEAGKEVKASERAARIIIELATSK